MSVSDSKPGGFRKELIILLLTLGAYLAAIALLFGFTNTGASSFLALLPVSFLAWRYGPLRGALITLPIFALTGLVFFWMTPPGARIAPKGPEPLMGLASWILVAVASGSFSRMKQRFQIQLEERQRLEAELRRYQDHLEEEILHRSQDLETAQRQLLQTEKMTLAGQLAGSLAHDFGNHLTVILGHAEVLAERLVDKTLTRHVRQIQDSGLEASELTRNLLALTRPGRVRSEVLDLNALLLNVAEMAKPTLKRRISLELELGASRHHVMGDPGQLKNAILNLLINARDAIPGNGTIHVLTDEPCVEARDLAARGLGNNPYVRLRVIDSGPGIPPEHLKRIFEPFFTTKSETIGTGLGLVAVQNTAASHHGFVEVENQTGGGSVFSLWLPLADQPPQESDRPQKGRRHLPDGTRILVIDDEDAVGEVLEELLQLTGASVIRYKDPVRALAWFRKNPGHCDAAIVDLQMPQMNGLETLEALHTVDPALPAILLTAALLDPPQVELVEKQARGILQKPCSLEELHNQLEKILAKH